MSRTSKPLRKIFMPNKKGRKIDFFETCHQCRLTCCQGAKPPITPRRRKIIMDYLEKEKISIKKPFVQETYAFPTEDAEGYCIFYDKKSKKCSVHPVKPETCKAGPVTFDINVQDGKIEWYLKMETICQLARRLYENGELFQKHLKIAKKEIRHLIRELDPVSLKAILKIEEPETFKIGEDVLTEEDLKEF